MKRHFFVFILVFLCTTIFAQDLPGSSVPLIVIDPQTGAMIFDSPEPADSAERPPDKIDFGDEINPAEEGPIEVIPAYLLADSGGNVRFIQRLAWRKAQFAVRYSVLLERKSEELGTFVEALRRNLDAETNYIDVSVPAGEYRYRVYSFNVLGQLDTQTEWEYFSVIKAIQPSILTFYPDIFYLDRDTPRIIDLTGENLLPDTDIYLVCISMLNENGELIKIRPAELHLNELGETAKLIFNEEDIFTGQFDIIAVNPGGLESRTGTFSVAIAKPFDINVAGGFSPSLSLVGQKANFLDQVFIPVSFSARGSYVPYKLDYGFFGLEAVLNWTMFSSTPAKNDIKSTSAHLLTLNANVLYQYWIYKNKLSFNGRAGLGFAGLFDYHIKYTSGKTSKPYNTAAFSINIGGSVQWFFHKQIFAEGGLDYNQIIHTEFGIGFVRIGLFCGYQF